MAFYKLTDEEMAKLPTFDQATKHTEMCVDDSGVPEMLGVEFPETNVGTRKKLDKCKGVTLKNMGNEERVLATLMSQHRRLGGNSALRELDMELCKKIVQFTLSKYCV